MTRRPLPRSDLPVRRTAFFGATVLLGFLLVPGSAEGQAAADGGWPYYGGERSFQRYAPHDQIDQGNVDRLQVAWRARAVDPRVEADFPRVPVPAYLKSTPVFFDGVLYAPDAVGLVTALDPATGETIWRQRPEEWSMAGIAGQSTRGVEIWQDGEEARILSVRGEYLHALDPANGRPIESFGRDGRLNLTPRGARRFNWSSGPIVVGDVIVIGGTNDGAGDSSEPTKEATPEDIRGYDVRTGRLLWTFRVVPLPGEHGNETWGEESWKFSGNLGAWCCLSADEELGYVYVPLTAPTGSFYGGYRPGDNLYSNALVALDARTGERVWHFQTVHHDLWEYDNVGPAVLGDITVDGRRIKAVVQANKTGFLFVLDRVTGEPVWPIEEKPVPSSTVPGEKAAPTQPVPTKPGPYSRQGITEDDLVDFTPELRERALAIADSFVLGPLFTPPSLRSEEPGGKKGTLMSPGAWGAGNWNTGAFDPETGMYYAVAHDMPRVYGVKEADPDNPEATMPYEVAWGPKRPTIDGLPITKPPYGRITAYDLNTGEEVWRAANGDGPRDHPLLRDLDLPPLGTANRPAALVTGSLLFIGEGSDLIPGLDEYMWGETFRAYDKVTGEVIWQTELPAGTTGGPMSYMHRGRQYLVVPVGGREHPAEWVALSLPEGAR